MPNILVRHILARKILLIISVLTIALNSANASQFPRYLGSEKKFRTYVYNPNETYRYLGHYTYQGFVEFDEGETVATISMGNPALWMFENLGNRLFLKPVGEDNSETNMTVITNKRVYHFELTAKEAKGVDDKDLIFVARFVYPDEKDKNILAFPRTPASDEPDLQDLSVYNFNYKYVGDPVIAPVRVFDNGEFTYIQFARKNAEVPAVFAVDSQGFESLVNFRAAGDYIIVEQVAAQYTLRNGNSLVCLYNMNVYTSGGAKPGEFAKRVKSATIAEPTAPNVPTPSSAPPMQPNKMQRPPLSTSKPGMPNSETPTEPSSATPFPGAPPEGSGLMMPNMSASPNGSLPSSPFPGKVPGM